MGFFTSARYATNMDTKAPTSTSSRLIDMVVLDSEPNGVGKKDHLDFRKLLAMALL